MTDVRKLAESVLTDAVDTGRERCSEAQLAREVLRLLDEVERLKERVTQANAIDSKVNDAIVRGGGVVCAVTAADSAPPDTRRLPGEGAE